MSVIMEAADVSDDDQNHLWEAEYQLSAGAPGLHSAIYFSADQQVLAMK